MNAHSSDEDVALPYGTRVAIAKAVRGKHEVGRIVGSTIAYTGPIATCLYAVQVGPVVDGLATDVLLVSAYDVEVQAGSDGETADIADTAAQLVRELITADPAGATALLLSRVRVNEIVADHPDIVVMADDSEAGAYRLGPLGIINGLLSRLGLRKLYVQYDDDAEPHVVTDCYVK